MLSFCFVLVLFQCEYPSSKKSSEFLGILVTMDVWTRKISFTFWALDMWQHISYQKTTGLLEIHRELKPSFPTDIHDSCSAGFTAVNGKKIFSIILLSLPDLKPKKIRDNHKFSCSSCVLKLSCIMYKRCSSCMKKFRRLCFLSPYFVLSNEQGKESCLSQIIFRSVISNQLLRLELIWHFTEKKISNALIYNFSYKKKLKLLQWILPYVALNVRQHTDVAPPTYWDLSGSTDIF